MLVEGFAPPPPPHTHAPVTSCFLFDSRFLSPFFSVSMSSLARSETPTTKNKHFDFGLNSDDASDLSRTDSKMSDEEPVWVVDESYHNQRWTVFKWISPGLPTDPPPWSDKKGKNARFVFGGFRPNLLRFSAVQLCRHSSSIT